MEKQLIIKSFNRAANEYEQHAFVQSMAACHLVAAIAELKISPRKIIDIGIGAGKLTKLLIEKYSTDFFGVDIAINMLKNNHFNPSKQRVSYICSDAENLAIKNEASDLVTSNMMLQWCANLPKVFTEVSRILLPGGIFAFTILGSNTLNELRHSWLEIDAHPHVHDFVDKETLLLAAASKGLTWKQLKVINLLPRFKTLQELMQSIKKIGAANIHPARHRQLTGKLKIQNLARQYEKFRDADQLLPATYEIYIGIMVKTYEH